MTFTLSAARHALLPALALLACSPAADDPDTALFRDSSDTTVGCPSCGGNSPRVNDTPVGKLRLGGADNGQGVQLLGLRPPGSATLHPVTTNADEDLVALSGGNTYATGADLLGWDLVLVQDGVEQSARIMAYERLFPMFTDAPRTMTAYALAFQEEPGNPLSSWQNVCPGAGPDATALTVIRGETYDEELKEIDDIDPDWITLACDGEAAFKVKRLGYGPTSPIYGVPPAPPLQRQATLKMVTADYCGTGLSFTEQGQDVYWYDAAGTVTVPGDIVSVSEAAWTAKGALCLDYPRFADPVDVAAECDLPACGLVDLEDENIVWFSDIPLPY